MYDMMDIASNKNASTDMNFYELIQSTFLKKEMENVFKCPEKGNYELSNSGKIKCSIHGTVDD